MQLRVLLYVLIVSSALLLGSALAWLSWRYFEAQSRPGEPCSSVIRDGHFIDESLQPYRLNGVITWWPKLSRLTLFGIRTDSSGEKVFNRTLLLENVRHKDNVVHGRVAQIKVATGDQLPGKIFLISEGSQDLTLLFKPVNRDSWLMMVNDNWVMMCEYK